MRSKARTWLVGGAAGLVVAAWPTTVNSALGVDEHGHAEPGHGGDGHGAAAAAQGHAPAPSVSAKPAPSAASKPAMTAPKSLTMPKAAAGKPVQAAAPKPTKALVGHGTGAAASEAEPAAPMKEVNAGIAGDSNGDGSIDAAEAMVLLTEGNQRWVSGKSTSPNVDSVRREAVAEQGQKPFVTILTCADSRIPVERVFDRGVGELFVIRVAGNVAGGSETGTIEYGTGHLKTPLVMVMGHTKCGAVGAAASNAALHGKVAEMIEAIKPAVERARRSLPGAESEALAAASVRENVWQSIFDLYRTSEDIRGLASKGEIKVVGAVYDIASGKVEMMGEHPWQAELIEAMNARAASNAARTQAAPHGE